MPPEKKPSQVAPETAVQGDEWDGPWGSISPVQRSIETLCIQIESEAGKLLTRTRGTVRLASGSGLKVCGEA